MKGIMFFGDFTLHPTMVVVNSNFESLGNLKDQKLIGDPVPKNWTADLDFSTIDWVCFNGVHPTLRKIEQMIQSNYNNIKIIRRDNI